MRLVLFANNRVGLEGTRLLRAAGFEIVGLVVHPESRHKFRAEIIEAAALDGDRVLDAPALREAEGLARVASWGGNAGFSLFFGHILRRPLLEMFPRGVLNLHPALLPHGRGSYPNVWAIVDGTPAGVTIHRVDEGVDTGPIVAQRRVTVHSWDTGGTLYRRLEDTCLALLEDFVPNLRAGDWREVPQSGEGTTRKVADVALIDEIDLRRDYTAGRLIDILRARTFPPHRGAFFRDADGRRVYLELRLDPEEPQS